MFVIPIGTRSTLALRPMVTISLITVCATVFILTSFGKKRIEADLFEVHRDLYAAQVRLYLLENDPSCSENRCLGIHQEEAIGRIGRAGDYPALESAIFEAMGNSSSCLGDLEEYGDALYARDESYYDAPAVERGIFSRWNKLKEREDEVLGGLPSWSFGLVPRKMNRIWTFMTHLFLHGDIWHLLGNMLFLWVVGCLLEDTWGRWPFLIFYLGGGIFAGWAHCIQDTGSAVPLIGASGAIASAMGAFTVRHFMTKIRFFYLFLFIFRPFWGTFHLPAFVFLPFWFAQQVALNTLTGASGGSDVAYIAHIAGYLGGVVTALAIKATGLEEKWIDPMVRKKHVDEGILADPRFEQACRLAQDGHIEGARALFSRLLAQRPEDYRLARDIAFYCAENGLTEDFVLISERSMKALFLKSRMEEASRIAVDLAGRNGIPAANPQLLMRAGKWLADQGRFGEAHDVYRHIIRSGGAPDAAAKASIALAKLLDGGMQNPEDALTVLEQARVLDIPRELDDSIEEIYAKMKAGSRQASHA